MTVKAGDFLIDREVPIDHLADVEALPRRSSACLRTEAIDLFDGRSHLVFVGNQETGLAVIDNLRQSAVGESDNRGSGGERLHGDQGACFGDKRSNDKAAGRGQDTALFLGPDRSDIPLHRTEQRPDSVLEIFEMGWIRKYLPGNHERDPRTRRCVHCDMHALFRADTSEDERVIALFRQVTIIWSIIWSVVPSIVDDD